MTTTFELCAALAASRSPASAWSSFEAFLKQRGFVTACYVDVPVAIDGRNPRPRVISSTPNRFIDRYIGEGLDGVDPALRHAARSRSAAKMGFEYFARKRVDPRIYSYYADLREIGSCSAIVMPLPSVAGATIRFFEAGSPLHKRDFDLYIADALPGLFAAAYMTGEAIASPGAPSSWPYAPLSRREHDVLQLLASGLQNEAIAHRLHLSVPAVKLYIRNARLKLRSATREMAVARAAALGLIDPLP
jgi:DNA-binding CsgD family transcriptional regulator